MEFTVILLGIPPPSTDLSALISKTLGSSKDSKKKDKYSGYENFAKSLGWDQEIKPKPVKGRNDRIEFPELNLITGEVEDDISKTVVEKELQKTNLKGLEKNKQLLNVSEKRLKEMRRVSVLSFSFFYRIREKLLLIILIIQVYPRVSRKLLSKICMKLIIFLKYDSRIEFERLMKAD